MEYNAGLFESVTIRRLLAALETMLGGIVADPDQKLMDLSLLSETERRRLLDDWNTDKDEELALQKLKSIRRKR